MSDVMEEDSLGTGVKVGLSVGAIAIIWTITALVGQTFVLTSGNEPAPTAWMFAAAIVASGIITAIAFWRLKRSGQGLATGALIVAVLSVLYVALAALGSKWGWWDFRAGFSMLLGPWGKRIMFGAVGLSVAALIVGLVTPRRVRPTILAIPATFIAVRLILTIGGQGALAGSVPPIHDIQTDWADPVELSETLMAARGTDSNPVRYGADAVFRDPENKQFGGKLIADIQEAAECETDGKDACEDSEFPKPFAPIETLVIKAAPEKVFEEALRIVEQNGWTIVDANPLQGRLEATHTSTWWGFKDDVAIRFRGLDDGSTQIDMRSISRVGQSDLGANARRITAFLYELDGQRYN